MVCHQGRGIKQGHFTTLGFAAHEQQWYLFNDSKVTPVAAERVSNYQSYLLFFRRRDAGAAAAPGAAVAVSSHRGPMRVSALKENKLLTHLVLMPSGSSAAAAAAAAPATAKQTKTKAKKAKKKNITGTKRQRAAAAASAATTTSAGEAKEGRRSVRRRL
jgi:hypothetical protein